MLFVAGYQVLAAGYDWSKASAALASVEAIDPSNLAVCSPHLTMLQLATKQEA